MNGEILNAMARLGGQYAAIGVYAGQDDWPPGGARYACCDFHNEHCEPPSELCCQDCPEAAHDMFPIRHADGSRCVLDRTEESR